MAVATRLGYKTIVSYVSALKFINITQGFQSPSLCRLFLVLRGVRRSQGNRFVRPQRLPITMAHFHTLYSYLARHVDLHDIYCFKAVFSLAFFGLLRVSEYTTPSVSSFDPTVHLLYSDVTFVGGDHHMRVSIKASKTDPFRKGVVLRFATIVSKFCPVQAILNYLPFHPTKRGPLFVLSSGQYLTREHSSLILAAVFPQVGPNMGAISSHSFRIGGASAASSNGVPDSTIQILGRWNSDCFRRYLQLSDGYIERCLAHMSTGNMPDSRIWDPNSLSSLPAVG